MARTDSTSSRLRVSSFLASLLNPALESCSAKSATTVRNKPQARTTSRRNVRRLGGSSCRRSSHTPTTGTATTTARTSSEMYLLSSRIKFSHRSSGRHQVSSVQRHPQKPADSGVLRQGIQASVVRPSQIDGHVRQRRTQRVQSGCSQQMIIDGLPRPLRATNHQEENQNQSEIFHRVQGRKPWVINRGVRQQILVWKEHESIKKDPSDQQEKKRQARPVRFLVGSIQMWLHRHRRHQGDEVKKQRRIGN